MKQFIESLYDKYSAILSNQNTSLHNIKSEEKDQTQPMKRKLCNAQETLMLYEFKRMTTFNHLDT